MLAYNSLNSYLLHKTKQQRKKTAKPTMTTTNITLALHLDGCVDIHEALELKEVEGVKRFTCIGCGEDLKAMRDYSNSAQAHFEHYIKNPSCKYI
ncbi:hypothetical protein [Vibrio sp. HN007]|uniref:hypothetical protein n=1 Tax=Vibrio iocasae TaxID=3098914 RepID=UPI0035D514C7